MDVALTSEMNSMEPPKTRRELKKDPRAKREYHLYSAKHVRITTARNEKKPSHPR